MLNKSILKTIVFILVCLGFEAALGDNHIEYDEKFKLAFTCAIITAYVDTSTATEQGRDSPYTEISIYYIGMIKYAGRRALDKWEEGVRKFATLVESNEMTLDGLQEGYEMCVKFRESLLSKQESQ